MTPSRQPDPEVVSKSPRRRYRTLPKGIWALGCVSMLMDISSELVHSLLPIFMATTLGASMTTIGVVEGLAEGAASVTKVFSGAISDLFGKRKFLAVMGYALGAVSKPVFPLAATMGWVFAARFVDRIGKGIRGAPRDALVADIAPPQLRGAAYGLRQSLDSVGAFIGPLLAMVCMMWLVKEIKAVLWVAVLPACLAVAVLIVAVREPETARPRSDEGNRLTTLAGCRHLPLQYWLVIVLGAVFTLARFSEAFLILRAQDVGLAIGFVPAIMIVMNVIYAAGAYPAGAAADRLSPRMLLFWGFLVLVAADVLLALAPSPGMAFMGSALWGLHMALTQGVLAKLVADTAPVAVRGTAFGIFNLVSGGALLLASVIAGSLWSLFGAAATFAGGALFAGAGAVGVLFFPERKPANG